MAHKVLPILAVSIGCPAGIGPEVAVIAAARMKEARCVLIGDMTVIRRAAKLRRVALERLVPVGVTDMEKLERGEIGVWRDSAPISHEVMFGVPDKAAGAAQLRWIDQATSLVWERACDALVTGPVSKKAIACSGAPSSSDFRGHTEHLQSTLGAREVVMAFSASKLTTTLATTHMPLSQVAEQLTPYAVGRACYWLARLLADLGKPRHIAVASLNPHAGEGGLLGSEEQDVIVPGMALARRRLRRRELEHELEGPMGAETAYRRAVAGDFDGVVAMYHDQATIPAKLIGFGEAVNVTLGLPIVRTSVDHGTGYEIAGSGNASARGMREALALAAQLASKR
jgi:4-hydroxythreonine-4-phosphate dehydrogenase